MAYSTRFLRYYRGGTIFSLPLVTTLAEAGAHYWTIRQDGVDIYAPLVDPSDAQASYLRVQIASAIYALSKAGYETADLLWSSSTPGSYSFPAPTSGYRKLLIYAAGAGGGGGGSDSDDSAGAGGGGASIILERLLAGVTFNITITIGAGGTPGVGTSILWAGTGGATIIDGFTLGGGTGSIRGGVTGWKTNSGYGGTVSGSDVNYTAIYSCAGGRGGQASQTGGTGEGGGSGGTLNAQAGYNGWNGGGGAANPFMRALLLFVDAVRNYLITSIGGQGGGNAQNGTTGTLGGGGGGAGEETRTGGSGGPGFCFLFGIR